MGTCEKTKHSRTGRVGRCICLCRKQRHSGMRMRATKAQSPVRSLVPTCAALIFITLHFPNTASFFQVCLGTSATQTAASDASKGTTSSANAPLGSVAEICSESNVSRRGFEPTCVHFGENPGNPPRSPVTTREEAFGAVSRGGGTISVPNEKHVPSEREAAGSLGEEVFANFGVNKGIKGNFLQENKQCQTRKSLERLGVGHSWRMAAFPKRKRTSHQQQADNELRTGTKGTTNEETRVQQHRTSFCGVPSSLLWHWRRCRTSLLRRHPSGTNQKENAPSSAHGNDEGAAICVAEFATRWQLCHHSQKKFSQLCASSVDLGRCVGKDVAADSNIQIQNDFSCWFNEQLASCCPLSQKTTTLAPNHLVDGVQQRKRLINWAFFEHVSRTDYVYATWGSQTDEAQRSCRRPTLDSGALPDFLRVAAVQNDTDLKQENKTRVDFCQTKKALVSLMAASDRLPLHTSHTGVPSAGPPITRRNVRVEERGKRRIRSVLSEAVHDVLCTIPIYQAVPIANDVAGPVSRTRRIRCVRTLCAVSPDLKNGSSKGMSTSAWQKNTRCFVKQDVSKCLAAIEGFGKKRTSMVPRRLAAVTDDAEFSDTRHPHVVESSKEALHSSTGVSGAPEKPGGGSSLTSFVAPAATQSPLHIEDRATTTTVVFGRSSHPPREAASTHSNARTLQKEESLLQTHESGPRKSARHNEVQAEVRTSTQRLVHEVQPAPKELPWAAGTAHLSEHPRTTLDSGAILISAGEPIACSLEENASTCRIKLKRTPASDTATLYTQTHFVEPSTMYLLTGLRGVCPSDPEQWIRDSSSLSGTPTSAAGIKISPTVVSPSEEEFRIPEQGRRLLERSGSGVACYARSHCRAEPGGHECIELIGPVKWIGPEHSTPSEKVICDRPLSHGCRFTIQGQNMDRLDVSAPRLALKKSCGTGSPIAVGTPIPGTSESHTNPTEHSETPSEGEALPARQVQTGLQQDKSSIDFRTKFCPADWAHICWNPSGSVRLSYDTGGLHPESAAFTVDMGIAIFLPLPYLEGAKLSISKVDEAVLDIQVDAIVEGAALSNPGSTVSGGAHNEHFVYLTFDDGWPCSKADVEITRLFPVSFSSRERGALERARSEASALGLPISFAGGDMGETLKSLLIDYRTTLLHGRDKLCWSSVFRRPNGDTIYEYRRKLGTTPPASSAVLEDGAQDHPRVVYCSLSDDPDECTVTVTPSAAPESGAAFLPGNSLLFVLRGEALCPPDVDSLVRQTFVHGGPDPPPATAGAVELRIRPDSTTSRTITFAFTNPDKRWISVTGVTTICWYPDETSAASAERLRGVHLGYMVWRGPSPGPLNVDCPDDVGCTITIEGRALASLNHFHSRLALLRTCGDGTGAELLTVTAYPPGYLVHPWVEPEAVHQFPVASEEREETFVIYGSNRLEVVCKEGQAVNIEEAHFQVDPQEKTRGCKVLDVTAKIRTHCKGHAICFIRPVVRERLPSSPDGADVVLGKPCRDPSLATVLDVYYSCGTVGANKSTSLQVWQNLQYHFSSPAEPFPIENMQFRAPPTRFGNPMRICWNPRKHARRSPSEYTVDLGVLMYFHAESLTDVRTVFRGNTNSAALEVTLSVVVDTSLIPGSFLYLNPAEAEDCDISATVPAKKRASLATYRPWGEFISILTFLVDAPGEAMTVCYAMNLGGEQRGLMSGLLPGSVNPRKLQPDEVMCGDVPDAPCSLYFYPMKIFDQYPDLAQKEIREGGSVAAYQHLDPFFDAKYAVYLVSGSCTDTVTRPPADASGYLEDNALRLSVMHASPGEVVAQVKVSERVWLARNQRARVCWRNEGSCRLLQTSSVKACVADVGGIVWSGLPLEWTGKLISARCTTDVPCTIVVRGEYATRLRGRVAILERCGVNAGPGIPNVRTEPGEDGASFALVSSSKEIRPYPREDRPISLSLVPDVRLLTLFEASGQRALDSKRPYRSGRHKHPTACPGKKSNMDTAFTEVHVHDVLHMEIITHEARSYMICWNPKEHVSTDFRDFVLPVGTVDYYGISKAKAFCVSGSRCTLRIPTRNVDEMDILVGIKYTDCSDVTLAAEFGTNGIFVFKKNNVFELKNRIRAGPLSLRYFKLCWCTMRWTSECTPPHFLTHVGDLVVQFLPFVDTTCPWATCSFALPMDLLKEHSQGRPFLTRRSAPALDCAEHVPKFDVTYNMDGDMLRVDFETEDLNAALGGGEAVEEAVICWRELFSSPRSAESPGPVVVHFEDTAVLGTVIFGGPHELQVSNMIAVVGLPFQVNLRVKNAAWLEGQEGGGEHSAPELPLHWRRVLIALPGHCGDPSTSPVAVLRFVSWTQSKGKQFATYGKHTFVELPDKDVVRADVCWCSSTTFCNYYKNYSEVVAKVTFLTAQRGLVVVCTYGVRCGFKYRSLPQETMQRYTPEMFVRKIGCNGISPELPAYGALVRVSPPPSKTAGSNENSEAASSAAPVRSTAADEGTPGALLPLETFEFQDNVSRDIFSSGEETRKAYVEYSLCYCPDSSSACLQRDSVEVGRMKIYDVWRGVLRMTISETRFIPLPTPFNGIGGRMYGVFGNHVIQCPKAEFSTSEGETGFTLDLRTLENTKTSTLEGMLLYCEDQIEENCARAGAARVQMADILVKGPTRRTWRAKCGFGSRCQMEISVFNPAPTDRIAVLSKCASSGLKEEYGINTGTVIREGNGKLQNVNFTWSKDFQEVGNVLLELCWCNGSTDGDCSSPEQFTVKVGDVQPVGLRSGQHRSCHVGTICRADKLEGYELSAELFLRIMANGCGTGAEALADLPQKGVFTATKKSDKEASFSLVEPMIALARPKAYLCQCSDVTSSCDRLEDYQWNVGLYTFYGPSTFIRYTSGKTGAPLRVPVPVEGELDPEEDFFIITVDASCKTSEGGKHSANRYWHADLESGGVLSWSLFNLPGNSYYLCYCRNTGEGQTEQAVRGFARKEETCQSRSSFETLVGVFLIAGPTGEGHEYRCKVGFDCVLKQQFASADNSKMEKMLREGRGELYRTTCGDGPIVLAVLPLSWKYKDQGESVDLKQALVTFAFKTTSMAAGGKLRFCWNSSRTTRSQPYDLGILSIAGPVQVTAAHIVPSGTEFQFSIEYMEAENAAGLMALRLQMFHVGRKALTPDNACKARSSEKTDSPMFRFMESNRAPDAIAFHTKKASLISWKNLVVVLDATTPQEAVGDWFEVCTCDTTQMDCSTEDNYRFYVGSLRVVGPYFRARPLLIPLQDHVDYSISGIELPPENALVFLPEKTGPAPRQCGDAEKEVPFMVFKSSVRTDGEVSFENMKVTWLSKTTLICWCGGTCSKWNDFRTQIGKVEIELPEFDTVHVLPGGVFNVTFRGVSVRSTDSISIVSSSTLCGEAGTERMDETQVRLPANSTVRDLNMLGRVRIISSDMGVAQSRTFQWVSWPIQVQRTAGATLNVCFCSSEKRPCREHGQYNARLGVVSIGGPSRETLEITSLEDGDQKVYFSGTALSSRDGIQLLAAFDEISTATAWRACNNKRQNEATIARPRWTAGDGTAQWYRVSAPPRHYVICWSPGAEEPPFEQSPAPESDASGSLLSSDSAAAPATMSHTREWYYVGDAYITGVPPGQDLNAVVKVEGTILVRGNTNSTHAYRTYLGRPASDEQCSSIIQHAYLTFTKVVARTATYLIFQHPPIQKEGRYRVCLYNVDAAFVFDVGYLSVTRFFSEPVVQLLGKDKLIIFPCSTRRTVKSGYGETTDILWLPDGYTAWVVLAHPGDARVEPRTAYLKVPDLPDRRNVNLQALGLRTVVACDADTENNVYFLGPHALLKSDTKRDFVAERAASHLYRHRSANPIDLTVRYPFAFITDYSSRAILAFNTESEDKSWTLLPTAPALLFSAGIEHADFAGGSTTALFVADTLNHIVGRLDVKVSTMRQQVQREVKSTDWKYVFGTPKTELQGDRGLSYPFSLTKYEPWSTGGSSGSLLQVLIIVGELRSSRLVLLSVESDQFQVYRDIGLGGWRILTGLHAMKSSVFLASRPVSDDSNSASAVSFFPINERTEQTFFTYPTFPTKLQSGENYSFLPFVIGPQIFAYKEDLSQSNLNAVGMQLDSETGEISGTWRSTGAFRVVVTALDLLGGSVWSIQGEAGCQAGEYYDESTSVCQPCPVGTFRDQESALQHCQNFKAYSSTRSAGSTVVSQCHCLPGFEITALGTCQPCPAGTYKEAISDSSCTGRCPPNMYSSIEGATSQEGLGCYCIPGYYRDEEACKPCPVGSYCVGALEPPSLCPLFSTTQPASRKSISDCLCVQGYTRVGDECVKCSYLTYKSVVGNEPCTRCPQPGGKTGASSSVLSSTHPEEVEYTAEEGATQLKDCSLCASGYFFDAIPGRCSTCAKDTYCPGLDHPPVACAKNSVTLGVGAETAFSCRCPKGYGRSGEQSVLDYSIPCTVCPKNTFQHMEGADSQCLPCPSSTHTEYNQSSSLSSCVALPGYFAAAALETELTATGLLQVEDEADLLEDFLSSEVTDVPKFSSRTLARGAIKAGDIRRAETKYEMMDPAGLKALPHVCMEGTPDYSYESPATKVVTHASRVDDCFLECARNVYCTRMTLYRDVRALPTFITSTANYTGVFFHSYWPCELHIFGTTPSLDGWRQTKLSLEEAEVLEGHVSCVLQRPPTDSLWRRITYLECPRTAFCPGGAEGQIFECAPAALTLAGQAVRAEQCACIPGYYPVGIRCEPCAVGTYKEILNRSTCRACPATMTTASSGSASANACACMPGLSMGTATAVHGETRSCVPCPGNMYCPGLWLDPPFNTVHAPPQNCPAGATVPPSTVNADSILKCLCLPGYGYKNPSAYENLTSLECTKCAPGSYKELQENSPCAGRCMKDAQTFEGAVSKKQCFCKYGKYAVLKPEEADTIMCHECIAGAVCPGGFNEDIQRAIGKDPNFTDITINDHRIPFPDRGFFVAPEIDAIVAARPEIRQRRTSFVKKLGKEGTERGGYVVRMLPFETSQRTFLQEISESWQPRFSQRRGRVVWGTRMFSLKRSETTREPHDDNVDQNYGTAASYTSLREAVRKTDLSLLELRVIPEERRIPDIQPCINDRRCKGGPNNLCDEGATGFMCAGCLGDFCENGFDRACVKCSPWWAEILIFLGARTVVCIAIWLVASVSVLGTYSPTCTQPVLLRMLMSNFFFFSVFGLIPETSSSALRDWGPLYRAVLLEPFVSAHTYIKLWCLARAWGMKITYVQAWYLQRYFQLCVPLLDAFLCTVVGGICLELYKVLAFRRIQKLTAVLQTARSARPEDSLTESTIRMIECHRCLGLLRYVSASPQDRCFTRLKRLLVDLIPALTVLWVWHYPMFVIECLQLGFCVTTQFKNGKSLWLLSSMPVQTCDMGDPWFLSGAIVGGCGLLLGGIGSIVIMFLWARSTADSDPVEKRLYHAFLTNGYSVEHRGWEALVMLRKALVASSIVIQVHPSSAGPQEIFRNSANLAVSVVYIILLLAFEPYDRRGYNVFTRVEFYGLLSCVVSGVIFQGSSYHLIFSYFGPVPLAAILTFYLYALWNSLVECGRTVIMQPHLARSPSVWRYYHRLTRSLARDFTAQQAKIYYNHLTKDLVLEAEVKSRLFDLHNRSFHKRTRLYQKIKYEYRQYFVAALSDSLSQVVISWSAFSIPGDWLDFTVRFAFCYCFWQRHCAPKSLRVPLDMDEFESLRPSMLGYWHGPCAGNEYSINDTTDGTVLSCSEAEEDLLQLMFDDDVYDDSPVTLGELYTGVEAMRNVPQIQLLRLHLWYRERLEAQTETNVPQMKEENAEIERELHVIQEELTTLYGRAEENMAAPFVLDFFLTVEMVQQARLQVARLQECLAKQIESATQYRMAEAVAQHMAIELQQESELEGLKEETDFQTQKEEKQEQRLEYLKTTSYTAPRRRTIELHDTRLQEGELRRKTGAPKFIGRSSVKSKRVVSAPAAPTLVLEHTSAINLERPGRSLLKSKRVVGAPVAPTLGQEHVPPVGMESLGSRTLPTSLRGKRTPILQHPLLSSTSIGRMDTHSEAEQVRAEDPHESQTSRHIAPLVSGPSSRASIRITSSGSRRVTLKQPSLSSTGSTEIHTETETGRVHAKDMHGLQSPRHVTALGSKDVDHSQRRRIRPRRTPP